MDKLLSRASALVGLGPACTPSITFSDEAQRKKTNVVKDGQTQSLLVFTDKDSVAGEVTLKLEPGKRMEHLGVKVEFIGMIEMFYGNYHEFSNLVRDLDAPGELTATKSYPFDFSTVDKQYDSYNGINVKLRYLLRVTVSRQYSPSVVHEQDIWVKNIQQLPPPEINNSIKMEVGIEDCLHIEFEYNRSKYHLKDVVIGKIYFLLVRLKIKHMEIEIRKRESTGSGSDLYNESETITKFEIMDGAPVRGESVPVRLFLSGFDLTPTYRNVNNKFSVKYYLNLVLVDEEDRRYFKQQEITLWRKEI
jgi:vacuolar protein sorting-associated protein 26